MKGDRDYIQAQTQGLLGGACLHVGVGEGAGDLQDRGKWRILIGAVANNFT